MFLVIFGVSEIPSKVIKDPEIVSGQAIRHEIVVKVTVPRDGQGDHAPLDRHPAEEKIWDYRIFVRTRTCM